MQEFKNKNDYTVTIWNGSQYLGKMEYVHNLYAASLWLSASQRYATWTYINVYARRSGRYLSRLYRGNFIPPYIR
jgi:hypothetical protein